MSTTIKTISPSTNKVISERAATTVQQAQDITKRSNVAFKSFSKLSLEQRRDIVVKALALIQERKMDLGRELSEQMGRPIAFSHKEIETMQKRADYLLDIVQEALAPIPGHEESGFKRFIKKIPVGPTLVVFAWNCQAGGAIGGTEQSRTPPTGIGVSFGFTECIIDHSIDTECKLPIVARENILRWLFIMDFSLEHHKDYIGRPIAELPTPSLIVSLPIVKKNIAALHKDVEDLGIDFRPHVKTLKTLEITRMMLGNGKYRSVVASTLAEIRGLLPLVKEGQLDEIDALEAYSASKPWDIFIKLDVGSHRAGVATESPALRSLVERAEKSTATSIYGFYCHAGHSYGGRSREAAEETLNVEITSVLHAASLLSESRDLVVSIGATPTAHVVSAFKHKVPSNIKLELHAGNFPCNDLQQVSTTLVCESDQAIRVATEVCGVYPERNEALVNAGAIALSRETSGYSGYGRVVGKPVWSPIRLSQEHGILGTSEVDAKVMDNFKVGDRVYLYCNHCCITAAAFFVFYVADERDVVVDTWLPWKGW